MAIDVDLWRARIGTFGRFRALRRRSRTPGISSTFLQRCLLAAFHFLYMAILLVIGNVELNPGPNFDKCEVCGFKSTLVSELVKHQRIHASNFNFRFVCPVTWCHSVFLTYNNLCNHVSNHNLSMNAAPKPSDGNARQQSELKCSICGKIESCIKLWCDHFLQQHLKSGTETVSCPLISSCGSARSFQKVSQLRPHLSQYHPGWAKNYSCCEGNPIDDTNLIENPNLIQVPEVVGDQNGTQQAEPMDIEGGEDFDNEDFLDNSFTGNGYTDEQIMSHLAKFYLYMQAKLYIPSSSVQKISKHLTFISEILQARYRQVISTELIAAGLSESQASQIVRNVLSMDPLYNSHHFASASGDSLFSEHRRTKYYEKYFQYVPLVEENLKINPRDRSDTIQYVPVKETLKVLLSDVSVQREVDRSFIERPESNIIRDYTQGIAFKMRKPPQKRIDIIVFQDGFGCANPLGSAKRKHKVVGVYLTLGNLCPRLRSRLKSKRLLMLVNDKTFSASENAVSKIFRRLVTDLKALELSGIEYKNEIIPVRLQFILGDNLGQHTIGGFLEGFTTNYFCRYCLYSKHKYLEDQNEAEPTFRHGKWRTPELYDRALARKGSKYSYKGIKQSSIFNELQYFKVSDPGQPGCVGHDIFLGGVADCDLAAMLQYFVTKGWFSYSLLNKRLRLFRCKGPDSGNKPALINESGKKLGGHAVQNWTLLRLLPFLIGDKIKDAEDPIWQLYLLLKLICEYACAPALSLAQIEVMRHLVREYMKKRKPLSNNYKPKHHYFSHLADHYLYFGPVINLWTLGFEHFHSFFKKTARMCNNYINLLFTLANRHQMMQAYQSTGTLFPEGAVHSESYALLTESYSDRMQEFLRSKNFTSNVQVVKKLSFHDIDYNLDDWILLCPNPGESSYCVGRIKLILIDSQKYQLLVYKYDTKFWPEYGLYKIMKRDPELRLISLDEDLDSPRLQAVYLFQSKRCFSLKHVLPQ